MFPAIIPPPFFNSLIAAVYSYRAAVTGSDVITAQSHYLADELVDWVRVDRVGCVDCDDSDTSDQAVDDEWLCHHVLIQLLAQARVVQV